MKTILRASPTSLRNVHIVCRLILLLGLFIVNFTMLNLAMAFLLYMFYYTISQSIMMHRYYSHGMFEFKNNIVKWIFSCINLMSLRGSPIGWSYIHKLHHQNTDTEKDPHSPHYKKFNILSLSDNDDLTKDIQIFKIRSIATPENIKINEYYWLYALSFPLVLLILDFDIFYFAWLLPICFFQISTTYMNYANHIKTLGSYRNYYDGNVGESMNNYLLWVISLGEAWHNNHHRWPGNYNFGSATSGKWWELDPAAKIIELVRK